MVGIFVNVDVTVGVGAVPHAESIRLIAKKRVRNFFIVLLVDGIILCQTIDDGRLTMVCGQSSIVTSKRNP